MNQTSRLCYIIFFFVLLGIFSIFSVSEKGYSAGQINVGLVLGGPNGITVKQKRTGETYEGAIARIKGGLLLQGGMTYHVKKYFYYNFSLRVNLVNLENNNDDGLEQILSILDRFSLRAPLGVRYVYRRLELFCEFALVISIDPDRPSSEEFAFGIRVNI